MNTRLVVLLGILFLPRISAPQETGLSALPSEVRGRVVRFDWGGHWSNVNDDLIVRVLPSDGNTKRYIRVVYQLGGQEAPVDPGNILPFSAFIGRGPIWIFRVKQPITPHEKDSCRTDVIQSFPVEDESGKTTIPRFIPTPGAEDEPVPPLETLPCFVLERGGLQLAQSN
jgi:hypothetical protein